MIVGQLFAFVAVGLEDVILVEKLLGGGGWIPSSGMWVRERGRRLWER